jgi:hypothetical protein
MALLIGVSLIVPVVAKNIRKSGALLKRGMYEVVDDGGGSSVVLVDFSIADSQKPRVRWRLDIGDDRSIDLIVGLDKKQQYTIEFGRTGPGVFGQSLGDVDGDGDLDAIFYPNLPACRLEGTFILTNPVSTLGDISVSGRMVIIDGTVDATVNSDLFWLWLDLGDYGGTLAWEDDTTLTIVDNDDADLSIIDNDDAGIETILFDVTQSITGANPNGEPVPTEDLDEMIFGDIIVILAS